MKKIILLLTITVLVVSCKSLRKIDENDYNKYKKVKKFSAADFKIYVFNICEKYGDNIDRASRFNECPDNFFEVAKQKKIKKVEELYLLIHQRTDLVIYFTTTFHVYVFKKQDGFLNDPAKFKNNIVLNEIENIYIGRIDSESGLIHFPSIKDKNDIIIHYDIEKSLNEIFLTKANIATAENDYDISEEIELDELFNQDLSYRYKENMSIKYFRNNPNKLKEPDSVLLDNIFITSKKGKVKTIFSFTNSENVYNIKKIKVKYHPNFSLIQE